MSIEANTVHATATLKTQVAAKLYQAILAGEYAPGDRLNEAKLADEYKTSRIPIREALIELQHSGLVMNLERRGMCVTKLSEGDMQRINSVRLILETEALWLARQNMTSEIAAHLEDIVEQMENMPNPLLDAMALDLEFHRALWTASGNHYLVRALNGLVPQLFAHKGLEHRLFARSAPPQDRDQVRVWRAGHHQELLDVAMGRKDLDPHEAVLNHLRAGFEDPTRFSSLEARRKWQEKHAPIP